MTSMSDSAGPHPAQTSGRAAGQGLGRRRLLQLAGIGTTGLATAAIATPAAPGLVLTVYNAEPGSPSANALRLLAKPVEP